MPAKICYCGLLNQEISLTSTGVEYCIKCNLPIEFSAYNTSVESSEELLAMETEELAKITIKGRS